jgi:hypothetical protein
MPASSRHRRQRFDREPARYSQGRRRFHVSPDASGYYTATLLGTGAKKFPVGAKMRAVALQGYFTQVSPAAARHDFGQEVTGDAVRRKVVDADKCSTATSGSATAGTKTQVRDVPRTGPATSGRSIPDSTMNT